VASTIKECEVQALLDCGLDLIIGSRLLKPDSQINNRNINSGDAKGHPSQLPIKCRKHLANSLRRKWAVTSQLNKRANNYRKQCNTSHYIKLTGIN
jgi:hypothetical protein